MNIMPTPESVVQFKAGLQDAFDLIESKDLNTVYFVTDTQRLFVGETEYSRPVQHGAALPKGYNPPNSLFVLETGSVRDLYFSADGAAWTHVAHLPAEITGGVFGDTTKTVGFGDTITVPRITVDDNGSVTAISNSTITLPDAPEDAQVTITPASAGGTVVTSVTKTPDTTTGISVGYTTPGGSVTGGATTFVTGVTLGDDLQVTGTTQAADTDVNTGTSIPTTQAVKNYVTNAISNINDFDVDSNGGKGYDDLEALQEAHAEGEKGIFYLVKNPDPESSNAFIEYFWTGTAYELAGQFGSVNTADFATKTEVNAKADKVTGATNGHLAGLDTNGNLTDSGIAASDVATNDDLTSGLAGKVDKVTGTAGHVVSFGSNSTIVDSGVVAANITTAAGTLTDGAIVLGSGSKGVETLANGTEGQVLKVGTDGIEWADEVQNTDTTYTFTNGQAGNFTVKPSNGSAQTVSIGKPATAGTADKVAHTLTINGQTFNGTADVAITTPDTDTKYTLGSSVAANTATISLTSSGDDDSSVSIKPATAGEVTIAEDAGAITIGIGAIAQSKVTGLDTALAGKLSSTATVAITGGATASATAFSNNAVSLNVTSLKAASLTGAIPANVTAVTARAGDNSTAIATTAFVTNAVSSSALKWGSF